MFLEVIFNTQKPTVSAVGSGKKPKIGRLTCQQLQLISRWLPSSSEYLKRRLTGYVCVQMDEIRNCSYMAYYQLNSTTIDEVVAKKSAGVYLLDRSTNAAFTVNYVGRADEDVANRLKQWAAAGRYKYFSVEYFPSAKTAFERECQLYHHYPNLDNTIHPARPAGTYHKCPVTGCGAL
jgi:hypothetical protein